MATVIEVLTIFETRINMSVNRELKKFQQNVVDKPRQMEYTPFDDLSEADLDDQLEEITDMHEESARNNIYDMFTALSTVQGHTQYRRSFRNKKES